MTTTPTSSAERWGIRGPEWTQVREIRDERTGRGWATNLTTSRKGAHEPYIDLFVDRNDGHGWVLVERIAAGSAS